MFIQKLSFRIGSKALAGQAHSMMSTIMMNHIFSAIGSFFSKQGVLLPLPLLSFFKNVAFDIHLIPLADS